MQSASRLASATLVGILCLSTTAFAQSESATISGVISDSSGAVIQDAQVELNNIRQGTTTRAKSNRAGMYVLAGVRPGQYRISAQKAGFKRIDVIGLTVNVQDRVVENFQLPAGSVMESVTVEATTVSAEVTGTVATVVDQKIINDAPLNGRSFQTLFQLTPGVVTVATNSSSEGQFSVNGQRANANYVSVDGASANVSIAPGSQPGNTAGGNLPAMSAAGGTNSIVSTDAVQEFAIQTSSFAPEYGRTPGGQVSVVTKSGTNSFHGDLFDYIRNDIFDANDWFANQNGIERAALRQNDFGGVFGGPVNGDKTFFFFSYEGLRLRQPVTAITDVPTLASRQSAPDVLKPLFNAFALPTGPDEGDGLAPAIYGISNPATLNAVSLRLDRHFGHGISGFVRYDYSPSNFSTRGNDSNSTAVNNVAKISLSLQTFTVGITHSVNSILVNDFRLNLSRSVADDNFYLDHFGGAVPFKAEQFIPAPFTDAHSAFLFVPTFAGRDDALIVGNNGLNTQRQLNIVDNLSVQRGSHLLKVGVDYRRLRPVASPAAYGQDIFYDTIPDALANSLTFAGVNSEATVAATYNNYSLYAQDTWNPFKRLTVTYGLRWDANPAPSGHDLSGLGPVIVRGVSNLANFTPQPEGTTLYHATWDNFAPRLGFSLKLRDSADRDTVLRGGAGLFYDLGTGAVGYAFTNAPFLNNQVIPASSFPLTPAQAAPPPITTTPPFFVISAFPDTLRLPYTYQWNLSVEQAMGRAQSFTVTYVGASAHSLVRLTDFVQGLPPGYTELWYVENNGYSNYNSLQAQFRRRTARGLDMLASYTFAHALDNGSVDNGLDIPSQFVAPKVNYGPADFDIRHTGSMALSYDLPAYRSGRVLTAVTQGWGLAPILTVRSSPPVDVEISRDIGFGTFNLRPDLAPGVPLYTYSSALPGGRAINPAALVVPTAERQGDLQRNFFRGFSLFQFDLALHRRFALREQLALDFRAEAFNLVNHPNFAPPLGTLGTVGPDGTFVPQTGFGMSQSMLNTGLSQGSGFAAGFNSLYQIGGPRSLQLAAKLEF